MITILSTKYPLQNAINQTRIQDTPSLELCKIHRYFGNLLGMEILGLQPLIMQEKVLTTGKRENIAYYDDSQFVIIGILRAGLYIAEGIRAIFPNAMYILAKTAEDIPQDIMQNTSHKKIILADSVVNSGKTIMEFLQKIPSSNTLYLATNVLYEPTQYKLLQKYALHIVTIRISTHSYVGQAQSDTGNRLFCIV